MFRKLSHPLLLTLLCTLLLPACGQETHQESATELASSAGTVSAADSAASVDWVSAAVSSAEKAIPEYTKEGLIPTDEPHLFKVTKPILRPTDAPKYEKPEYPQLGYEYSLDGAKQSPFILKKHSPMRLPPAPSPSIKISAATIKAGAPSSFVRSTQLPKETPGTTSKQNPRLPLPDTHPYPLKKGSANTQYVLKLK